MSLAWVGALLTVASPAAELQIDFARPNGVIRALHGGNNGPLNYGELVDLTHYHRELALPFTRLHDSAWPYPDIVDIHAIFPDFNADPARPASYRFGPTDDYLRAVTNTGARVVYRLGESIEHAKRKRYVHPPTDPEKWAAICVGLIRHYNEGWADGHHLGIQYWEIWNEPENRPAMWTGTPAQFYRLYSVTAKTLKHRWPQLKIGGPALGHQGDFKSGALKPSEFLRGFVDHVRREKAPWDFFSWHAYKSDPHLFPERARAVRAFLDAEGFAATESHLNEWNYLPDDDWGPMTAAQGETRERWYARQGGAEGAAFTACVLMDLQDAPLDVANFYSADSQPFGLFTQHGAPKKNFHAFKAFRALLDAPQRVTTHGGEPGKLSLCAGDNSEKKTATVLVSNLRSTNSNFTASLSGVPWSGATTVEVLLLDETHNLARTQTERFAENHFKLRFELKPPAVALIRLRATETK